MAFREKQDEREVMGVDEALARISTELLDPRGDKLFTVTDLTPEEIFGIPLLLVIGEEFKSRVIEKWVKKFLLSRISRFRLGRREFVLLGTGIRETEEKRKKMGIKDVFAGF
jgi:hypothetical protein